MGFLVKDTSIVTLMSLLVFGPFKPVDSDEDASDKSADEDHQQLALEELTNLQFKFEIKEVGCCSQTSQAL